MKSTVKDAALALGSVHEGSFVHFAEIENEKLRKFPFPMTILTSGVIGPCTIIFIRYVEKNSKLTRVFFCHCAAGVIENDMLNEIELIGLILDPSKCAALCFHYYPLNNGNKNDVSKIMGILKTPVAIIGNTSTFTYNVPLALILDCGQSPVPSVALA